MMDVIAPHLAALLEAVLAQTGAGLAVVDAEGRVVQAWPQVSTVLRCAPERLEGGPLADCLPAHVWRRLADALRDWWPLSTIFRLADLGDPLVLEGFPLTLDPSPLYACVFRVSLPESLTRAKGILDAQMAASRQALHEERHRCELDQGVTRMAKVIVEKSPVILFRRLATEDHRLVYVSENIARFGYRAEDFLEGRITYDKIVHPEDHARLGQEINAFAKAGVTEYVQEYRVVSPEGQIFWVHDETAAEHDEAGLITHYQGIVMDVTARKLAEIALAEASIIVERSPIILFRRDATRKGPGLDFVSQNVSRLGYRAEDLISGALPFLDIVHPDDRDRLLQEVAAYREARTPNYSLHYRLVTATGEVRWFDDVTTVDFDAEGMPLHFQGVLADVTDRVQAAQAVARSEEKHRRILETAGEGFIMMDEDLRLVWANDAYCDMLGYAPHELVGRRPAEWATEEFRAFITTQRDKILAQERRRFEGALVAKDGHVAPVLVNGSTLRDADGAFLANIAFVTDLTEQKKALALAEEVQKSLLPQTPPRRDRIEIAGRMLASDSIGGDYYDYLDLPATYPGWLGVVVGDIAGHGVDAALLMTTARAFLRQRVQLPGDLAGIVADLNKALSRDMGDSGRFMTFFQLLINRQDHELRWIRAGHDPALLYDPATDQFHELGGPGLPLGIAEDASFHTQCLDPMGPGLLIAVGTDGIWEAMDAEGRMYGKDRFRQLLRAQAGQSAEAIVDAVFADVHQFRQGLRVQDDVTLVIIKLHGSAA